MWSLHLREKEKTSGLVPGTFFSFLNEAHLSYGVSLRRCGPGLPEELLLHAVLESEVCVEGHGRGSLVAVRVRKVPVLLEEVSGDIGGPLLGIYARSILLSQPIRGLLAPDNRVNLMPVTQNRWDALSFYAIRQRGQWENVFPEVYTRGKMHIGLDAKMTQQRLFNDSHVGKID